MIVLKVLGFKLSSGKRDTVVAIGVLISTSTHSTTIVNGNAIKMWLHQFALVHNGQKNEKYYHIKRPPKILIPGTFITQMKTHVYVLILVFFFKFLIPFSRLRKKYSLNFFLQPKTFFQYSSPLYVRFFFCKSTWRWQIWKTKKWVILYSTINNVLLLLNIYIVWS